MHWRPYTSPLDWPIWCIPLVNSGPAPTLRIWDKVWYRMVYVCDDFLARYVNLYVTRLGDSRRIGPIFFGSRNNSASILGNDSQVITVPFPRLALRAMGRDDITQPPMCTLGTDAEIELLKHVSIVNMPPCPLYTQFTLASFVFSARIVSEITLTL